MRVARTEANRLVGKLQGAIRPAQKVGCDAEGEVGLDKTGVESEAAFSLADRLLGAALQPPEYPVLNIALR